jgi:hypothetical protein
VTVDVILIVAGCVLLLIGLVGGGINSKYLSVQKVEEGKIRFLCGSMGLGLIVAGVWLGFFPGSSPKSQSQTPPQVNGPSGSIATYPKGLTKPYSAAAQEAPKNAAQASLLEINITIGLSLGNGLQFGYSRQSEDIELFIDDRRVVEARIDQQHPHRTLKVRLDREGLKSYRVSSVQAFTRDEPPHDRFVKQISGQGTIAIKDGDRLRVENSYPAGEIILVDDSSDGN